MSQTSLDGVKPKLNNNIYACVKCHVLGDDFRSVLKGKYKRILLEHIVGSMWQCPKCKTVYYDRDFDRISREPKKFCTRCGNTYFRYDPVTGELICMRCGLVS